MWNCRGAEDVSWVGYPSYVAQDGFCVHTVKTVWPGIHMCPRAAPNVAWMIRAQDASRTRLGAGRPEVQSDHVWSDYSRWQLHIWSTPSCYEWFLTQWLRQHHWCVSPVTSDRHRHAGRDDDGSQGSRGTSGSEDQDQGSGLTAKSGWGCGGGGWGAKAKRCGCCGLCTKWTEWKPGGAFVGKQRVPWMLGVLGQYSYRAALHSSLWNLQQSFAYIDKH